MSLKGVRYTKLETDDSDAEDDESPPRHVRVSNGPHVKGRFEVSSLSCKLKIQTVYLRKKNFTIVSSLIKRIISKWFYYTFE